MNKKQLDIKYIQAAAFYIATLLFGLLICLFIKHNMVPLYTRITTEPLLGEIKSNYSNEIAISEIDTDNGFLCRLRYLDKNATSRKKAEIACNIKKYVEEYLDKSPNSILSSGNQNVDLQFYTYESSHLKTYEISFSYRCGTRNSKNIELNFLCINCDDIKKSDFNGFVNLNSIQLNK